MDIVKLPSGMRASPDTDCISVQELPDGQYQLNGSVLVSCGDSETAESVALIGGEPYDSYDAAEEAGLAWASEHCVERVYVSRSDGTTPLPEMP
jgi:hypothetical protein